MAWNVGPEETKALRHSLSTLVIFIYSKIFWLNKSSLKLLNCGCAALWRCWQQFLPAEFILNISAFNFN